MNKENIQIYIKWNIFIIDSEYLLTKKKSYERWFSPQHIIVIILFEKICKYSENYWRFFSILFVLFVSNKKKNISYEWDTKKKFFCFALFFDVFQF